MSGFGALRECKAFPLRDFQALGQALLSIVSLSILEMHPGARELSGTGSRSDVAEPVSSPAPSPWLLQHHTLTTQL